MAFLGTTHHRASGPSYLTGIPAVEWVRRLDQFADHRLRGALANIIDWDFFLHLGCKAKVFQSTSYLQLKLWAEPYPAGDIDSAEIQAALKELGWNEVDAKRRAFGDWEKQNWNPFHDE